MAVPNSFSNDGASGAADNGISTSTGLPAGATPPPQFSNGFAGASSSIGGPPPPQWSENFEGSGPGNSSVSWGSAMPGLGFDDGGDVPDSNGAPQQDAISQALDTVDGVLAYGRKLHGLGGDDDGSSGAIPGATETAQNMPSVPGSQSNSGIPSPQPMPGPLPPTSNPFGQRTVRPPIQMSANMPAVPGSQTNSGVSPTQPMPGPLPPTSNPFGQRTTRPPLQMSSNDDSQGAIDTEDT